MKTTLILVVFLGVQCYSQAPCDSLVDRLLTISESIDTNLYQDFLKCGKRAIPSLIGKIDVDYRMFVGYQEPTSSTLHPVHFNYAGIRAAYMIEYIISGGEPYHKGRDTTQYRNRYNLFTNGVIVRTIAGVAQMRPLEARDMVRIKSLYGIWWKRNASKSSAQLKRDWHKGMGALKGSKYVWY